MSEEIKFRNVVITQEQREFSTTIEGDKFTLRIPLPFEKVHISSKISRAIGGSNLESIPASDYEYTRKIVTLNHVIVLNPDWWKGADQCPDEELLEQLWRFFGECEKKFSDSLKRLAGTKTPGPKLS